MNAFLAKIYAYKSFDDLILIYPLYVVMFADSGLSAVQIGVLLTVWVVTALALEIPFGVLGDKYSRKHILFFAQLTRVLGYACWLFFPNFAGFLVGFVFWGIKSGCTSGTFEALVFDELKRFGKEDEFTKVIGRAEGLSLTAVLLASMGASAAVKLGYPFVLSVSMIPLIISSVAVILLPKATKAEHTQEKHYFALLKSGLAIAVKTPTILRLLVFMSLAIGLVGALDEFWPLFGSNAGLSKSAVAVFFGAMYGVQALGSVIAHWFRRVSERSIYLVLAFTGALLVFGALTFKPYSVLFLVVLGFLFKVIETVLNGKLQHAIPTETRATVSSVKEFLSDVGAAGILPSFGAIASAFSYQTGFMVFGYLIIFVGLIYFLASLLGKNR